MEIELQIYLIVGVGSFFIAALILTSSLLVYYVVKLYKKVNKDQNEDSYLREGVGYSNNEVNLDDELNRRYTMHTPEPQSIQSLDDRSMKRRTNKDSGKLNNIASKNSRGSVIDVSEEFNWRGTGTEANSKYNTNITLREEISVHESRTAFNDQTV